MKNPNKRMNKLIQEYLEIKTRWEKSPKCAKVCKSIKSKEVN